ncbi:hypothetical protein [Cupriavidus sp. D384]|uniref:hypothetical protein n=1 Tax=Cupriavidus sp. D384 TaxID=1538095 RepID=UPI00082D33E2|nr:hypothetical protein [Cupriavidus sp. D384]
MKTVKELFQRLNTWLMTPALFAKRWKRFILLKAIRSRLFMLAALFTCAAELSSAAGATWKAIHPPPENTAWLLWTVAVLMWIYFALMLFVAYADAIRGRVPTKD